MFFSRLSQMDTKKIRGKISQNSCQQTVNNKSTKFVRFNFEFHTISRLMFCGLQCFVVFKLICNFLKKFPLGIILKFLVLVSEKNFYRICFI